MMQGMVIDMNDEELDTLAQLQAFLDGTRVVEFAVAAQARYEFIARTVRRFGYAHLRRAEKAVVLRFLERVSGYSRQQLTRLVRRVRTQAPLRKRYRAQNLAFVRRMVLNMPRLDKSRKGGIKGRRMLACASDRYREQLLGFAASGI